jgi:hypothetical protein
MARAKRPDFRKLGLLNKYIVSHPDGRPLDKGARYFCMRYDKGGRDIRHIGACRLAIRVYATLIRRHLPKLAKDLEKEVGTLSYRDLCGILVSTDVPL